MAIPEELEKHLPTALEPLQDTTVVDVDVHVSYAQEELKRDVASRMEKPYRDYVDPEKTSPAMVPQPGWPKSLGGRRPFNLVGTADPESVQIPLEEFGVDYPILNILAHLDRRPITERALAEMRAVNDMLLDRYLDEYDNFYGLASIAAREPDKAAEEIDRLGDEKQIIGVFLAQDEYAEPFGHPSQNIMYQAIEDNDLTAVYHTAAIDREASILRGLEKVASWHSLVAPWSIQLPMVNLLFEGVPEKFPGVNHLFLEGSISWIPGMLARLNREYGELKAELPLLQRTPEEYAREHFYFGTQPLDEFNDPEHMRHTLEMLGTELICFSTDHPHYDFDHPQTTDNFLRNFSDDDREKVLNGNAKEAFDLRI